jgi:hypothetical protein
VVFAVEVVVMQVVGEISPQAAEADVEVARECRAPTLFEDRAVQSFDVSDGLWAPRSDLAVSGAVGQP